jgi:hypothetical protein
MIKNNPRCLIGTLYVGENELSSCEYALYNQNYPFWNHFRFDHLPEKEAHEQLYTTFMHNSKYYDYFIKLDADMVLRKYYSLYEMIRFIANRPKLDHVCFAVHDYMTNRLMMGLHIFSNRSLWPDIKYSLFPDQAPRIPGKHLRVSFSPAPVAHHASDPSPYQSFHFGAHRVLKALNPLKPQLSIFQWRTMLDVYKHCKHNADSRLRLALLGGWHVWKGDLDLKAHNSHDNLKTNLFNHYINYSSKQLEACISSDWLSTIKQNANSQAIRYLLKKNISHYKERLRSQIMLFDQFF